MDNASVYKSNIINKSKLSIKIDYLTPFSQTFNLIEEVFALWEHNIKKIKKSNKNEIFQAIMQST